MEVIKVNKMEVRMDEKQTVWDVAEELRKVLRANEKRFMTLPAVREKLSSQLRKHLGMTGRRLTAPSPSTPMTISSERQIISGLTT